MEERKGVQTVDADGHGRVAPSATPATSPRLNPKERLVLEVLWGGYGALGFNFNGISNETGLTRQEARRACRSLTKKGLAEYVRVLWNEDDGTPAGAGYECSDAGDRYCNALLSDGASTRQDGTDPAPPYEPSSSRPDQ